MNGLTTARTWAIDIGLANAPSGVGDFLSRVLRVAACRASIEWIDSAAASTSLLLIAGACPRYAAAPRFSTAAASLVTDAALLSGNLPTGLAAGLPMLIAALCSAATCCASSAPNDLSTDSVLPLNRPLLTTSA